ncbi:MAG: hypothetical protein L0338_39060 [Acidobacteria bacterium]|nr:hypothetical protein [Acidobacteriota bacterium]
MTIPRDEQEEVRDRWKMNVKFTLRGRQFDKGPEDLPKAAKGLKPSRIQKYSTVVNGVRYPIRQLVAALTGVPAIEITSQDAYRILHKLGAEIKIDG